MDSKKIISNFCSIIFEPRGRITNNDIEININSIPSIDTINKEIKDYCNKNKEIKHIFFKKIPKDIKEYLELELPFDIVKDILERMEQIKIYVYHIIYNNWYKNFLDILIRMKEDYELYHMWTDNDSYWNDSNSYQIFKNIILKEKETNNYMRKIISELPKNI